MNVTVYVNYSINIYKCTQISAKMYAADISIYIHILNIYTISARTMLSVKCAVHLILFYCILLLPTPRVRHCFTANMRHKSTQATLTHTYTQSSVCVCVFGEGDRQS